jgi:hypothetical protein
MFWQPFSMVIAPDFLGFVLLEYNLISSDQLLNNEVALMTSCLSFFIDFDCGLRVEVPAAQSAHWSSR